MKKINIGIIALSLIAVSCGKDVKEDNSAVIINQELNMEHRTINFDQSRREGSAHSGRYFSSLDSATHFGVGYEYVLPDSLKNKNAVVYISCWVREQALPIQGEINIGISDFKGVKKWAGFRVKEPNFKPNEWCYLKDSIIYTPNDLNNEFTKIGVIAIKDGGNDLFDVDDLKITYKFYK